MVAPAGCGKTQLIADALAAHDGTRPILVLTHTNAGVAALRARLARAKVPARSYRLSTIDGWAMRIGSLFPQRSGLRPETLELRDPARDYREIRNRTLGLLAAGHITKLLRSSYARVIVDEYQDCSRVQHAIIERVSDALPVVVLGDPMQAIFGWAEPLAHWEDDVCACFPVTFELSTPWRWANVGEQALGEWLLEVRARLARGEGVDLRGAPPAVRWVPLDGTAADYPRQLSAAQAAPPNRGGSVLILVDSRRKQDQRRLASHIKGATTVEAVDLRDFVDFADELNLGRPDVLSRAAEFAQTLMTGVRAGELVKRVATLESGRARTHATEAEAAALRLKSSPSHASLANLLEALNRQRGVRVYRPDVLRACVRALRRCVTNPSLAFGEAARRVREENRAGERTIARRAVGSTLLLKGLEADVAVLVDPSEMDAKHLYVAMTRGARRLTICARRSQLVPRR